MDNRPNRRRAKRRFLRDGYQRPAKFSSSWDSGVLSSLEDESGRPYSVSLSVSSPYPCNGQYKSSELSESRTVVGCGGRGGRGGRGGLHSTVPGEPFPKWRIKASTTDNSPTGSVSPEVATSACGSPFLPRIPFLDLLHSHLASGYLDKPTKMAKVFDAAEGEFPPTHPLAVWHP